MQSINDIEAAMRLQNDTPLDMFCGLTPTEMHFLLYAPFGYDSPVRLGFKLDDADLDRVPLFRIVEEYLKIIQREKFIKLTPLGALPKKVMVELYAHGFLPDEHIESGITKLSREQDCISIMSARLVVELAGLVKKVHGKLSLTKNGTGALKPENRTQLFRDFFRAFVDKFNWGYNDGYAADSFGQFGWAFSIYLVHLYGDQPRSFSFYGDKYLTAFPHFRHYFTDSYAPVEYQAIQCYLVRTFRRFMEWFGFVTTGPRRLGLQNDKDPMTATELGTRLFQINTISQ